MKMTERERTEWVGLFQAAVLFAREAFWDRFEDNQLFGVADPVSGEIGYAAIMGYLGEVFGLAVYFGDEGFAYYQKVQSTEIGPEDPRALFENRSLVVSFEDRKDLASADRCLIKELGLQFRGKKSWPVFRSLRPGFYPWNLDLLEVRFLQQVLEQVTSMARSMVLTPGKVPSSGLGEVWVRVPEGENTHLTWKDTVIKPKPPAAKPVPLLLPDPDVIEILKKDCCPNKNAVLLDWMFLGVPAQENKERPYFPFALLLVNSSGLIEDFSMGHPQRPLTAIRDEFLNMIRKRKSFWRRVSCYDESLLALIGPSAQALGIPTKKLDNARTMHEFRKFIYQQFNKLTQ
jgi:hypothetical protein